ncbi:protein ImpA [Yersinia mollaretii]|uniref:type VI secretion system protein TssA n=1 Tax=Yersinia mollaretii TaxID=33060 RepID=UPI0005E41899|nr:type VI secretion system ImpA family N-terminal domain-containing protein [Yersinia mollaretii]CNK57303.1 protein ImpA [Yersinia mollaretii]
MSVQSIAESTGYYHRLMQPIPGDHPCGISLEYDSAFLLLQTKLQPKITAEYGTFVEVAEPTNWTETERKCLELLGKARDVRLIIILMRCRMCQIGVSAVQEGLEALLWCLTAWPDGLHPQLFDEGEFEPFMRANAFAELEDSEGFIADLRNLPLPKAAGMQISLKEFEKAHSFPREEGALEDATLEAIKQEWLARSDSVIISLQQAYALLLELASRLGDSLGDVAPDFVKLTSLLCHFGRADIAPIVAHETHEYSATSEYGAAPEYSTAPMKNEPHPIAGELPPIDVAAESIPAAVAPIGTVQTGAVQTAVAPTEVMRVEPPTLASQPLMQLAAIPVEAPALPKGIQNRADALSRLIEVRQWFTTTEPSSPVIDLLSFSEKMIGKSFGELLQIIPQELISKLDVLQE